MMVAPVRRSSIVIGKCLGGATVASFQGVILIALAGLVGVPYDPLLILGIFGLQLLLAFTITAFGVMVAARIKQMQSFMGVMQMIVMPMFFISGALFPVANLPGWLAFLNRLDPLTYAVDPMRRLVFDHLDVTAAGAPGAGPGRDLVRLARADGARGRRRRRARPGDARDRDLGVQRERIAEQRPAARFAAAGLLLGSGRGRIGGGERELEPHHHVRLVLDAPALGHARDEQHAEASAAAEVRCAQLGVGLDAGVAHLDAHALVADVHAQVDLAVLPHAAVSHAVGDDLGHQQL